MQYEVDLITQTCENRKTRIGTFFDFNVRAWFWGWRGQDKENMTSTFFVEKGQRILKINSDFQKLFSFSRWAFRNTLCSLVFSVHNSGHAVFGKMSAVMPSNHLQNIKKMFRAREKSKNIFRENQMIIFKNRAMSLFLPWWSNLVCTS